MILGMQFCNKQNQKHVWLSSPAIERCLATFNTICRTNRCDWNIRLPGNIQLFIASSKEKRQQCSSTEDCGSVRGLRLLNGNRLPTLLEAFTMLCGSRRSNWIFVWCLPGFQTCLCALNLLLQCTHCVPRSTEKLFLSTDWNSF